jgi:xanthine/uracil/vitamin C permease (AzgA family)
MRTRADESLAVWGGANGPPGSVFLAQRLARQFGTILYGISTKMPSKVAPQAATNGHMGRF